MKIASNCHAVAVNPPFSADPMVELAHGRAGLAAVRNQILRHLVGSTSMSTSRISSQFSDTYVLVWSSMYNIYIYMHTYTWIPLYIIIYPHTTIIYYNYTIIYKHYIYNPRHNDRYIDIWFSLHFFAGVSQLVKACPGGTQSHAEGAKAKGADGKISSDEFGP